ncbi:AsnC family transcriptional regulator [Frankia sp. AgPm24]|uniref:AsnC family transcriptional regulator n=1 Tax=Frankia umida TaxID=573489 RepID=A0ABT0K5E1_9ACTN|nr:MULTISPECIES: AsnC family transcriptional regulator [Frankia]MCK9879017.1 AsnC family transcriptional regulator [Frankia umida]MCK9920685.1 AsnC family transcriptional regulator [Frankia sp. AgPm24]
MTDSLTVDELDRQLLQALQIDGRAPFSAIAEVTGVSAHTVARRYHRMRASAGLRVVGRGAATRSRWMLRIRCAPDAAGTVAAGIARRADTSFVALTSGTSELLLVLDAVDEESAAVLLDRLARTPTIVSVTAQQLLRTVHGGPDGWFAKCGALTTEQVTALRLASSARTVPARTVPARDDVDRLLLRELGRDGRAGYPVLGASVQLSEASVRRRLARLQASGAVYFDLQFDAGRLGYHMVALLWLTVVPPALEATGAELARHPEVAFVAATTGGANLVAAVICCDADALYSYLTRRVAALHAVTQVETATVLRQIKQLR